MARTRAQVQAEKQGKPATTKGEPKRAEEKPGDGVSKKRSAAKATTPASKKRKTASPPGQKSQSAVAPKIDQLINENGSVPLADLGLQDTERRTSETVLAHVFNALISSARIGHDIAHRTLQCLVDANYHHLETLKKSTWEERTKVLTEGGYTHYREKTATYLGELAQRIEELYDDDATRFLDGAGKDSEKKLKEIKGLGPLGVDIFFETIQAVDPDVAPFMGKRNLDAAKDLGLGSVEDIWLAVGRDNKKMSQLCAALTKTRLEGNIAARK